MADYVVETGKGGRYITKEEALEIFKKAEDNGFVHQITNIDGEDKIFAICNCNVNVCYAPAGQYSTQRPHATQFCLLTCATYAERDILGVLKSCDVLSA